MLETYLKEKRTDNLYFLGIFGAEKMIELFELFLSSAYKQGQLDGTTKAIEKLGDKSTVLTPEQQGQLDEMIEGEIEEALIDNQNQ